jgi:hypothetical protein
LPNQTELNQTFNLILRTSTNFQLGLMSSTSSDLAGSPTASTLLPMSSQLREMQMADLHGSISFPRSTHLWSRGCVPFFLPDSQLPIANGYSLCSSWRSLLVIKVSSPKSFGAPTRSVAEPVKRCAWPRRL